jgi:hypothetical protein
MVSLWGIPVAPAAPTRPSTSPHRAITDFLDAPTNAFLHPPPGPCGIPMTPLFGFTIGSYPEATHRLGDVRGQVPFD